MLLGDIRNKEQFMRESALVFARTNMRIPSRDESWEMAEQYRYHDSDPISHTEIREFSTVVQSMLDADRFGYRGAVL